MIVKIIDAEYVPQQFFALNDTPHDLWKIKVRKFFIFHKWMHVRVRVGADVKKYIGQKCRFHESEIYK